MVFVRLSRCVLRRTTPVELLLRDYSCGTTPAGQWESRHPVSAVSLIHHWHAGAPPIRLPRTVCQSARSILSKRNRNVPGVNSIAVSQRQRGGSPSRQPLGLAGCSRTDAGGGRTSQRSEKERRCLSTIVRRSRNRDRRTDDPSALLIEPLGDGVSAVRRHARVVGIDARTFQREDATNASLPVNPGAGPTRRGFPIPRPGDPCSRCRRSTA